MTSEDAPLAPHVCPHPESYHLVWLAHDSPSTAVVLAQAGIESEQVYRSWHGGFGAVLSAEQVNAVRGIPGVRLVEQDTEGRPAPYERTTGDPVVGSYLVQLALGADPTVVAGRAGVTPTAIFRYGTSGFGAVMSDEQLDRVRRDPEVTYVEDDAYVYLDDC
ncbi:protease inhibitor I9 family protein [Micromonospora sp. NPDC005710]|uniref:protease inhibitor I9 family protein n=1 Tax=Micromonospora sp. NPDC005710 TaxID=3157051 RepID=UPI003405B6E6